MKKILSLVLLVFALSMGSSPVYATITTNDLGYDILATNENEELTDVKEYRVIDGDTAEFQLDDNKTVKARFLLIDTPELKHPQTGEQPFAKEAKSRLEDLFKNADKIQFSYDVGERKDRYNRDLVYVWVDGLLVQEILATEGLAQVTYIYPPNTKFLEELKRSESYAKRTQQNIWSVGSSFADNESNSDDVVSESAEPVYYKNCSAVRAAGAAPIYPGDPGWDPKFDRDNDGVGCE